MKSGSDRQLSCPYQKWAKKTFKSHNKVTAGFDTNKPKTIWWCAYFDMLLSLPNESRMIAACSLFFCSLYRNIKLTIQKIFVTLVDWSNPFFFLYFHWTKGCTFHTIGKQSTVQQRILANKI